MYKHPSIYYEPKHPVLAGIVEDPSYHTLGGFYSEEEKPKIKYSDVVDIKPVHSDEFEEAGDCAANFKHLKKSLEKRNKIKACEATQKEIRKSKAESAAAKKAAGKKKAAKKKAAKKKASDGIVYSKGPKGQRRASLLMPESTPRLSVIDGDRIVYNLKSY